MTRTDERNELHKAIWGIADSLRGSVSGWEFKAYVLGALFYRFISERLETNINAGEQRGGNKSFVYGDLSDAAANKAKKAIRKAFEKQMAGEGFTFVEVLSTCPTNWGMSPVEAMKWLEENMIPYYPLGVYKDKGAAE